MNAPVYRTIKQAVFKPAAERNDDAHWLLGDTVYVTFEECDHVAHGNPTMHYKPATTMPCRECEAERVA